MHWLDWLIIVAYLVYIIYDGLRMTKKSEGIEGYFLANRSLPWWAVGLSVMATQLSAITLVGTTGQAYADGMRFIQFYFGLPLAMIILCVTVVPFFYRAKVYTAYEYLEKRFDAKTRSLTSFFFLVSRGLSVGVIVAAPSVILSIVLGWNSLVTVLAMGLSTTVYTMFGGVQAVTWTDVKQMIVIFAGVGVVLAVIISGFPADVSVGDALKLAGATGRLKTIDTSFKLDETYTLWSGLLGGLFLMLSYFGCDQSQVQRYLTARSISEGRVSLLMSAFIKIPMQFLILMIGVMVFIFYQFQTPPMIFNANDARRADSGATAAEYQAASETYKRLGAERQARATELVRTGFEGPEGKAAMRNYLAADSGLTTARKQVIDIVKKATGSEKFSDVNYVFPVFVTTYMPPGVIGLIIAAIFAAAMSSISAELSALSTATVIDFYRRHFRPEETDRHYLLVSKVATGFWGIFACVVAYYAGQLGSLIEVVNKFGSFFYGSLLGVFVLALGIKRATARGAFWGLLAGIAAVGIVSYTTSISFLWYNVVGCAVVVAVGMLLSLTEPQQRT
jgi:Na+/proline symporter